MFKIGDKGHVIKDTAWLKTDMQLEIVGIYIDCSMLDVKVISEQGAYPIGVDNFELAEDKMVIKIRNWEELDGKKSGKYIIELYKGCIMVCAEGDFDNDIIQIGINVSIEYRIAVLKALGFYVEFITEPTLTEEEWHFVRAFKDGWIARDKGNAIWLFEGEAYKSAANDDEWLRVDRKEYYPIKMSMFKFITWADEFMPPKNWCGEEPCEWCELEDTEKIYSYGMNFKKIEVKFCPNCGRPLRKESDNENNS